MVYRSCKTSVENGIVYDVMDVFAVELHGNHMAHFLHRWDKVILGLAEPMPENTKKASFVSEVRDCPASQRECLDSKRKSDDDPTKTLDTLRIAMKEIIEDARREQVREEELRGFSGYTGGRGRQRPPAYAAGLEDSTAAQHAESPAPNGGSNGRGRSTARRTQRSASPGVRSTASNDMKGKGKGKFDSKKTGCMYFNQGTGSCLKADRCIFPMVLTLRYMSPKEKVKESVKLLIRFDPHRPQGEGDAIPPDVVHFLLGHVEDDL